MPLVKTGKVSGRGGWKTGKYMRAEDRQLNDREMTEYERYCEYCIEAIGCEPAADYMWYVETSKISVRSL